MNTPCQRLDSVRIRPCLLHVRIADRVTVSERNGTERNCGLTRNSRGTLQIRSRWSKRAATVLRLRLLPPDGQVSGSKYTGISGWLRGPY